VFQRLVTFARITVDAGKPRQHGPRLAGFVELTERPSGVPLAPESRTATILRKRQRRECNRRWGTMCRLFSNAPQRSRQGQARFPTPIPHSRTVRAFARIFHVPRAVGRKSSRVIFYGFVSRRSKRIPSMHAGSGHLAGNKVMSPMRRFSSRR